jgi:hypothetical protein
MSYQEQDKNQLIVQDQRLEQWHTIWQLRVAGLSLYDIAKKCNLTITNVRNILDECRKEFRGSLKNIVEEEMHLDLARCDEIIAIHQPVSQMQSVMVQRMNSKGESYTDDEWKYPMESTKLVLAAIKLRGEILGYKKDNPAEKGMDSDSILWVRRAAEAKVIQAEPLQSVPNTPEDSALDLSWPE